MKSRERFLWGIVFIVLVCGFASVVWTAEQTQAPRHTETTNESHQEYCSKEAEETLWQRTECDPVAAFTAMLVLFTAVLAVISTIQIRFLIRADKTSEAASIAALKTAETAIVQAAHMDRSR
jgi:CDP-diglyceride synthetase